MFEERRILRAQPCQQVGGDLGMEAFDTTLDLLEWVDYFVGDLCGGYGVAVRGACPHRCVVLILG
ncbi:hypothetical protein [Nocardia asiatica]|uniref:hypothetical protein n=1 Tax=Nocardia asiatica TaxID=209252 RepID=UPI003EE04D99